MSAMRATLAPNEQAFHRKMTKKFKPYNNTRDITLKAKHLEIELTDQIAQVWIGLEQRSHSHPTRVICLLHREHADRRRVLRWLRPSTTLWHDNFTMRFATVYNSNRPSRSEKQQQRSQQTGDNYTVLWRLGWSCEPIYDVSHCSWSFSSMISRISSPRTTNMVEAVWTSPCDPQIYSNLWCVTVMV